jgi:hypothetical protein
MAFTLGALTEIDDTAVDAESPITESLMTSLRDNAYWIVAGTTQTTESTAGKLLETSGSGDLQWTAKTTIAVDKTKGSGTVGTGSGSPTVIAIVSDKIIRIFMAGYGISTYTTSYGIDIYIDSSDDTYEGVGYYHERTTGGLTAISGTMTGSFVNIGYGFFIRKNGTDYEIYEGLASSGGAVYSYLWL